MVYDCLIIGAGPAGMSAALQCRARGLSALLVGNPAQDNPLRKAEQVDNYLGLPGRTGQELMEAFSRHAAGAAEVVTGRVNSALSYGGAFALTVGSQLYEGRSVILALGTARAKPFPDEARLLGKGVSYCASCDGMLYRSRDVAVIGLSRDAAEEAGMLAGLGCKVTFLSPKRPSELPEAIPFLQADRLEILGEDRVTGVLAGGQLISCQGVFILRDTVAPSALFPGLELEGGFIRVDRSMATNLPGVFACGDCTGQPFQIAKAVGEGQMAAHSASLWLQGSGGGSLRPAE